MSAGFFWFECKEVWIEGLRSYFLDWWNCLDMMVLSMYLASFALRVVIMLKGIFVCELPETREECIYFTDSCERNTPLSNILNLPFICTEVYSSMLLVYFFKQKNIFSIQSIQTTFYDILRNRLSRQVYLTWEWNSPALAPLLATEVKSFRWRLLKFLLKGHEGSRITKMKCTDKSFI